MKHMIRIVACLALCALALTAIGCSQSVPSQSSAGASGAQTGSKASADASSPDALGKLTVEVTNATGYDVVAVRVKAAGSEEFSEENSFYDLSFGNGKTIELTFNEAPKAQSYDVVLVTSDNAKIGVKDIDLAGATDIVFHFKDGLGYITYTDSQSGKQKDTMEAAASSETDSQDTPSDLKSQMG